MPKSNRKDIHNTFIRVILYKLRQILENKTDTCDIFALKQNSALNQILEQLSSQDYDFTLDLQEFNLICYEINEILIEHNYFLRVFEQKNKYRQILVKKPEKQNQVKQLATCLIQKYNDFQVVKTAFNKKQRRNFEPVDIIYIPTKNAQILPECYYTTNIANAYTALYSRGLKQARAFLVYECYYCNKFFLGKKKCETHTKVCSEKPGIIYNFCMQTLTSFEDNYASKGDLPFIIYFDFETTSPTDAEWLNPEDKQMFVVSYVMIVAFHPFLKILIQGSVSHSKEELTRITYLTHEQFEYKPPELIKQLYDQALHVSKRTCKNALAMMFGNELAFVKKTLLSRFSKKIASQFKQLEQAVNLKYQKEHPLSYNKDKCTICKMPIRVAPTSPNKPNSEMTCGDYIVRYEYKFIRNIYTQEQLEWSDDLKSLEAYYEAFENFIQFSIEIYRLLSNYNMRLKDTLIDVRAFIETNFADCDFECIKNKIMQTDIKHTLSTCGKSIPKFRLKIYAYLYDELICFPPQSVYDVLVTKKFFQHVHNQITMKTNLHHSHITGDILGYAHDFCNTRVLELEKSEIPCVAHNLFGFDFFYFMKGFSTTS